MQILCRNLVASAFFIKKIKFFQTHITMQTPHDDYFKYLKTRSRVGHAYRQFFLYPKLVRHLHGKVLDIGCGIGDMLGFRPGTVGTDVNPKTVEYCKSQGFEACLMDFDVLPFDDKSFDSILLDNVLEHLQDPRPLLNEALRVLRKNGVLLIGVPGIRGWASDSDHKVFYDEEALVKCLDQAGFSRKNIFHTPVARSEWLSRRLRQYCIYGVFSPV
jgi:SAM-dependent methyltransferase